MGRQHQGMDRPGVRQVPEGSGEQGKMGKTGCEIICGALTTLAVKGQMRDYEDEMKIRIHLFKRRARVRVGRITLRHQTPYVRT